MADLVDTSDWQKRYGGIENAYCQGRWAAVMENGTVLLRELLDAGGDPEVEALRHRMQLLMAHTLLHGYGDRDAAEDLYEVVRNSDSEPTLRQIAEDGLDLCHQPLPSTLAIEEDGEDNSGSPSPPVLFLPDAERTDLEDEGHGAARSEPSRGRVQASQMPLQPLPQVRSEANPEAESPPDIPPEPESDLGVATDPFGASGEGPLPLQDKGLPVMPWLTEPSAAPRKEPDGSLVGELPWVEQKISETLTAEVVEEPELIELHQATPSMAEEVDLQIKEDVAQDPKSPQDGEPEEDGDLRTGLLLVVVG
jgi:hypothetical protein